LKNFILSSKKRGKKYQKSTINIKSTTTDLKLSFACWFFPATLIHHLRCHAVSERRLDASGLSSLSLFLSLLFLFFRNKSLWWFPEIEEQYYSAARGLKVLLEGTPGVLVTRRMEKKAEVQLFRRCRLVEIRDTSRSHRQFKRLASDTN